MTILGLNEKLLKKAGMLDLAKKIEENCLNNVRKKYTSKQITHDSNQEIVSFNIKLKDIIKLENGIELLPNGIVYYGGLKGHLDAPESLEFLSIKPISPLSLSEELLLMAYNENQGQLKSIEKIIGDSISDITQKLLDYIVDKGSINARHYNLITNVKALNQLEKLIDKNNGKKSEFIQQLIDYITNIKKYNITNDKTYEIKDLQILL